MHTTSFSKSPRIGFDELVQGVSRLNSTELTVFFEKLNHSISGEKARSPFGEEAILLKQIKAMIPESVIRRYKALKINLDNQTISEKEHEEILSITDFIEQKSAERMELLAALAALRQMPIQNLAKLLQLKNYHA